MGLQGRAGVHMQWSKRRGRSGARWREEEGKEGDEADRWGRAVSETGKRAGDACAWEGAADAWAGAVSGGASAQRAARLSGERAVRPSWAEVGGKNGPRGIGPSVGEEGRSCAGLDLVVGLLGWFASSPFLPLFFFLSTQNYLNSN